MVEPDMTTKVLRQRLRRRRLLQRLVPVQRLENAFAARHGAENDVPLFAHRHDRAEHHVGELCKKNDAAECCCHLEDMMSAEPDDRGHGEKRHAVHGGAVIAFDPDSLVFLIAILPVDFAVAFEIDLLPAVKLHDLDAGEVLLQVLIEP